ncbi:pro-glucagon-like [Carassius carassius]|uniref:pro-glucagon-like n=1 Tax=Carassius carassius TaxID=217509 RepID=UPI002868F431|nr:pro-glucagon-like [Carassius carassius]
MKGVQYLAGLLLFIYVQNSICVPLQDDSTSTETVESLPARGKVFTTAKRHSEGTFSNDYNRYLETRRAQDFVQRLMNSRRNGVADNRVTNLAGRRHVDGSFTSDVNKVLDSIAAKEYLQWVMNSKTSGTSGKRGGNQ